MEKNWHSISLKEVFALTVSAPGGLTAAQAEKRKKTEGPNALPQEKPYSRVRLFLRQFESPLVYILLITAGISSFLTHYSDTLFILAVLFINTTVGFYQENKANRSLIALKQMVRITARVLRDGRLKEVDSEDLVVGDVAVLRSGDKVPADGRIIESVGLYVNESSLTGESLAVEKKPFDALDSDTPLPERGNMVFMGSIAEEGRAKVLVTATGLATEIGEIASLLKETKELRTPLQQKIAALSRITALFILSVIGLIIVVGSIRGESFGDIFTASLALAVSAIPEGLLPGITVILVLGMRRILKQNGLVRRLAATETLGSVTVICTDKTGTLTEGSMRVSRIVTSKGELTGEALKIAVLSSEAFVENPDAESGTLVLRGRPTEQAILRAGLEAGLDKLELEKRCPALDRISFDSNLKYAATLHRINDHINSLYVVGAPEEIISRAVDIDHGGTRLAFGTPEADALMQEFKSSTREGLRVLAVAKKDHEASKPYHDLKELLDGLTLVGFIALKDPLRPDARASIKITKQAGIRTVIITGDHRLTARAVAQGSPSQVSLPSLTSRTTRSPEGPAARSLAAISSTRVIGV
jgi:Ca2+-transporting ATPase